MGVQEHESSQSPTWSARCLFKKARATFQALNTVVRSSPSTLLAPITLFLLLVGVGSWAVSRSASDVANSAKVNTQSIARNAAAQLRSTLYSVFSPVEVLASVVAHGPMYDSVRRRFTAMAPALYSSVPTSCIQTMVLAPAGVARLIYPNKTTNGPARNSDIFSVSDPAIQDALRRSLADPTLSMDGPLPPLPGDPPGRLLVVRKSIHVEVTDANETFGRPDVPNPACGAACAYQPAKNNSGNGTLFWGLATASIALDACPELMGTSGAADSSPLRALRDLGFHYTLRSPSGIVASSDVVPHDLEAVEAVLDLPGTQWVLQVGLSRATWTPAWFGGVLAAVVVAAALASLLLFALMVSRRRHEMLLEALLPRELIRGLHTEDIAETLGPSKLHTESPAELLLSVLVSLLSGSAPDLRDVVLLRTLVVRNADWYSPMDVNGHIKNANLDTDVARELMRALGNAPKTLDETKLPVPRDVSFDEDGDDEGFVHDLMLTTNAQQLRDCEQRRAQGCKTLRGALDLIMTAAEPPAAAPAGPAPALTRASLDLTHASSLALAMGTAEAGDATGGATDAPAGEPGTSSGPVEIQCSGRAASQLGMVAHLQHQPLSGRLGWLMRTTPAVMVPPQLQVAEAAPQTSTSGRFGPAPGALLLPQSPRQGLAMLRRSLEGCQQQHEVSKPSSYYPRAGSPFAAMMATTASRKESTNSTDAVARVMSPVRPRASLLDEVELLLSGADELQYDTWALAKATGGRPLSAMGFYLLQREGLVARFRIEPIKLVRLLGALEAGYPSSNPYHNATHAADVLRTLHVLMRSARLTTHFVEPLGLLAAYFAAIVHDHGHPGLTGDFLVATSHPLALRYNDRSPLESHHAASAFTLLAEQPELDVLAGLSREERAAFRKQVVEMVMATDMKQHFTILSHFTTTNKLSGLRGGRPSGSGKRGGGCTAEAARGGAATAAGGDAAGAEAPVISPPTQHMSSGNSSKSNSASSNHALPGNNVLSGSNVLSGGHAAAGSHAAAAAAPRPADEADRMLTLQLALKVADIGHLAGDLAVHQRWLGVLEEEFFRQGDQEKALGLPISPLFDRTKQGVSKSQVGFFDFVALPLVRAMADAFPGAQPLLHCFEANYRHWQQQQQ